MTLYNSAKFKSQNQDQAFELMDENPFATVITVVNGEPFISHLPLTPKKVGDRIELIGHLARANPHAKVIGQHPILTVFHGPHTYITPEWYAEGDVPTWNYSLIHATGTVELVESYEGLVGCLKELSAHAEKHWPSGWNFFIPDDLSGDILTRSILGFKILIQDINYKIKMTQTRSSADRAGVMQGLTTRQDGQSQAVLKEMRRLYHANGEFK